MHEVSTQCRFKRIHSTQVSIPNRRKKSSNLKYPFEEHNGVLDKQTSTNMSAIVCIRIILEIYLDTKVSHGIKHLCACSVIQ